MAGPNKDDVQKERDAKIIKLWNQGLSQKVIATRVGLSISSISAARERLGLKGRPLGHRVLD